MNMGEEEDKFDKADREFADIPADMRGLPKPGQVVKPTKLKMQYEDGLTKMQKTAKRKAAARRIQEEVNKKVAEDSDLTSILTESIETIKVKKSGSGEFPAVNLLNPEGDTNMAAKKKKSAAKKPSSNGRQSADPIGRPKKILIRLSEDEYNKLQAKANKTGISMASVLRSSFS